MTEDYKEKLIKYMTGNIEPETGTDEPQFIDKGIINQNVENYLDTTLGSPATIRGYLRQKDYPYYLIYGFYKVSDSTYNGFIYIMNIDLEPLSLITEYNSGTAFRPFVTLNIDEEGYVYGVDNKFKLYDDTVPNDYRFIMLNKILKEGILNNNFIVQLRQSYFFPTTIVNQIFHFGLEGQNRCFKKSGSAEYFMIIGTTLNDIYCSGVIKFQINVGATNTWIITKNNDLYGFSVLSVFPIYNNDNLSFIIEGESSGQTYNTVQTLYVNGETPTFSTEKIYNKPETQGSQTGIIRTNILEAYVSYERLENDMTYQTIYKLNPIDNSLIEFYVFSTQDYYLGSNLNFFAVDELLFFKYGYFGEQTSTQGYPWNSKLGLIYKNQVYTLNLEQSDMGAPIVLNKLFINKIYNLVTIYSPLQGTTTQKIQLVFNQSNYNGLPYETSNCLMPNSGILYDTDDNIIFARNLYNKTVLGATTTSTVQIPNTMLNDVTIGKSNLISETNLSLTEDTTDITKNIYETVNINFANSISIRNDNDPNNTILNPTAAARLNGSTTQNNNYDDVKATKVRVNYTDGTNMVIALNPSVQINALTDTTYQYNFILYVSKAINNLEIISNDELTGYQTIDNLTLEVGKTYNILQGVEVQ